MTFHRWKLEQGQSSNLPTARWMSVTSHQDFSSRHSSVQYNAAFMYAHQRKQVILLTGIGIDAGVKWTRACSATVHVGSGPSFGKFRG